MDYNTWQTSESPARMLLTPHVENMLRKRNLIIRECLHWIAPLMDDHERNILAVWSDYCEGHTDYVTVLNVVHEWMRQMYPKDDRQPGQDYLDRILHSLATSPLGPDIIAICRHTAHALALYRGDGPPPTRLRDMPHHRRHPYTRQARQEVAGLIRHLIWNPWEAKTPTIGVELRGLAGREVWQMALEVYDTQSPYAVSQLHDALLDIGCESHQVLHHLRTVWHHPRGCWAIDSILGKPDR